jgi:hypothetical protein
LRAKAGFFGQALRSLGELWMVSVSSFEYGMVSRCARRNLRRRNPRLFNGHEVLRNASTRGQLTMAMRGLREAGIHRDIDQIAGCLSGSDRYA